MFIYTTQYRKDNLLCTILVTRDTSQSSIRPYRATASADGLLYFQLPTASLIFPSVISSSASTLVNPQTTSSSSRKSAAVRCIHEGSILRPPRHRFQLPIRARVPRPDPKLLLGVSFSTFGRPLWYSWVTLTLQFKWGSPRRQVPP